jgi:hypothetical protein
MTVKYCGTHEQFYEVLQRISTYLHIRQVGSDFVRFDLDYHVVVHWWWETGTVLFQGPARAKMKLQAKFLKEAGSMATADLHAG